MPSVVFVSNYFNHHQSRLSEELHLASGGSFFFIETEPMEEERMRQGWGSDVLPSYVIQSYPGKANEERCKALVDAADVVIFGSAPEFFIRDRQDEGKLIFRYSERIYKSGYSAWKYPVRAYKHYKKYRRFPNTYLLCASAYTAADFSKTRCFLGKSFRWGYFPEVDCIQDAELLFSEKDPCSITWVGRLIQLKHPEIPLRLAKELRDQGIPFELTMIGCGELEEAVNCYIEENGLHSCVRLIKSLPPREVRQHMRKSSIFVFTSDFNEGWGAVLNEAMSSGCAVVASHAIGSVPFLISNGENGLIYRNGDYCSLLNGVKQLLLDNDLARRFGKNALETIECLWNEKIAAARFIEVAEGLLQGKNEIAFDDGPMSPAPVIDNDWYSE